MKVIKFLGSVYFAIFLISTTAVGVIAGTLIESKTESHLNAEEWIYSSPIFYVLLLGYFLNILISALLRYPFKKHHIPFLITHLGLLMIISGVFIKAVFGVQGHVRLMEGTYTDQVILPNKKAIGLYGRNSFRSIPFEKLDLAPIAIKVLDEAPHGEETYLAWDQVSEIISNPPMPLGNSFSCEIGDKEIALNFLNRTQMFDRKHLSRFISYDEGFQGYTVFAEFPFYSEKDLLKELQALPKEAPLSPPLQMIRKLNSQKFPHRVSNLLRKWKDQGEWLYTSDEKWLEKLDWKTIDSQDVKALYWIAELFDHPQDDLLKRFPFKAGTEKTFSSMLEQIYSAKEDLPKPPSPPYEAERSGKMLSAYLRLFSIHLDTIPQVDESETVTLESPLKRVVEKKEVLSKKEENSPYLLLDVQGEKIPLLFDPQCTSLKWPLKDHQHLIRYEPMRIQLPYYVRLHRAKEIKYPQSEQTLSYECALTLTDKRTDANTSCILSMNEVHETTDGYRFYLAGMGPADRYGVKNVQLVVNRDPAKYLLTYPGGLFVSLGILLLYKRKFFI